MATPLILKRGSGSRSFGQWRDDDYDVLDEGGTVVGRIFKCLPHRRAARGCGPSGHGGHIERDAHGYEATREAAMAAFAKSWRRQIAAPISASTDSGKAECGSVPMPYLRWQGCRKTETLSA